MKLSTAGKCVVMSYFLVHGGHKLLATATRVVYAGQTRRFLFPDGSVLESNKGHWREMKNPKLDQAIKRFGNPNPAQLKINAEVLKQSLQAGGGLSKETLLELEVEALQNLLNEKDEQIDARPLVVRFDWWAVALIGAVLVAHYGLGLM